VSIAAACGGWIAAGVLTALWLAAQRVLDARMEAVARACHELRGPIGAARLGLELASRAGSLSAEQLRAIDSELGRATLALEDLAAAAEGRNPRWEAGAVDLESLLAETVAAWTPSAAAAGIELRMCWTGGTSPVRADRLRLAQATSNLIANAIEHGGEWVEVRGCSKPPSGETEEGRPGLAIAARIEVIDDGRGLPVPLDELTRRAGTRRPQGAQRGARPAHAPGRLNPARPPSGKPWACRGPPAIQGGPADQPKRAPRTILDVLTIQGEPPECDKPRVRRETFHKSGALPRVCGERSADRSLLRGMVAWRHSRSPAPPAERAKTWTIRSRRLDSLQVARYAGIWCPNLRRPAGFGTY
jgi:hypothetical protein